MSCILRLKYTKFDFGCGSIPDPAGEPTALPRPSSWISGGLLLRERRRGKGEGEERKGKGREGKGKGRGDGKGFSIWGKRPPVIRWLFTGLPLRTPTPSGLLAIHGDS